MNFDRIILCSDAPKGQGLSYYYYRALCDIFSSDKVRLVDDGDRQYGASILKRGIRRINYEMGRLSEKRYDKLIRQLVDGKNLVILFNNGDFRIKEIKKLASNASIYLVNYISDSPLGIIPSRRQEALDCIPFFDLVCTFAKDLVPVIYQLGAQRVERIPFGYCRYTHLEPTRDIQISLPNKVFYFGTWTVEIESWVNHLTEFDLEIHGHGWNNARAEILRSIGTKNTPSTEHNMAIMARKSGVVVNFTRAMHGCFHTMKTFELTIAGACVISNFSEEQNEFFKDKKSMVYFNNADQLVSLVKHYLNNVSEGVKVRECAIQDAMPHSYHSRAAQLLEILK